MCTAAPPAVGAVCCPSCFAFPDERGDCSPPLLLAAGSEEVDLTAASSEPHTRIYLFVSMWICIAEVLLMDEHRCNGHHPLDLGDRCNGHVHPNVSVHFLFHSPFHSPFFHRPFFTAQPVPYSRCSSTYRLDLVALFVTSSRPPPHRRITASHSAIICGVHQPKNNQIVPLNIPAQSGCGVSPFIL